MKLKHTPGPWKATKGHIGSKIADFVNTGKHDGLHISIGEKRYQNSSPESEANALLIAAAPEILDCLIEHYKWLDSGEGAYILNPLKQKAIIEKATGKTWEDLIESESKLNARLIASYQELKAATIENLKASIKHGCPNCNTTFKSEECFKRSCKKMDMICLIEKITGLSWNVIAKEN